MTGFTALNFTQIIAPTGGAASAPLAPQAAPLAGVSSGAGGILGVAGGAPTTDIFTLLLNQGNILPKQAKFSTAGQNVPEVDVEKLKTADNSIDALQSVLTNLIIQQAVPQQPQQVAETVAGGQGEDALLGGLQSQQAQVLQPQSQQISAQSIASIVSGDGADNVAQQVQDLLAQNGVPATYQPKTIQQQVPSVDAIQQGKTLNAYRQAAALTLPEVGSTIDAPDSDAIAAVLALPKTDETTDQPALLSATSKQDAILGLLDSKDRSPATLADSIGRLKNLSAITPLPADTNKVAVGATAEGSKPLEQIASLQKALAGVKAEPVTEKIVVKADTQAANNNAASAVTPQVVAQTQQQNLSQQFGHKKQDNENIDALKSAGKKAEVSDLNTQQQLQQRVDAPKLPAHDFAQHLNKAAIVAPSEQIAMQIAKLPSGKQNITIQLDPADLGKVDVKLEIGQDGRTHISIAAERKETLDMLKNDATGLQRSLADSGIKADAGTMQFNLKNQEGFASQLNQGDGQKNNNNNQAVQHIADVNLKQTIESASLAARYINLNNLLDLKV